jgi:hypothetical protein
MNDQKKAHEKSQNVQPQQEPDAFAPLAPFNQTNPFELAVLAVLLSKGKRPNKFLPVAASLWAEAYSYYEKLRWLYWGEAEHEKFKALDLPVFSLGDNDEWLGLETLIKEYPWSVKHWRECLKEVLPQHVFQALWKRPVSKIRIPRRAAELVIKCQERKRSDRSKLPVKPVSVV